MTPYRPPRWLPGGHLQTIVPYFFRKLPLPRYRRERIATPDADFIDLDWVDGARDQPLVALFHGLEGSSKSHYARALMHTVAARGWRGVVAHWRGCSGEPNLLPRAYHSGDYAETEWLINAIRERAAPEAMFAVGVSLGGSALLNWLGRAGSDAGRMLSAAAAISAPLSLRAGGEAIQRGFNLIYTWNFLRTMQRKALEKARRFPGKIEIERIRKSRTLYEFDDAYTAPMHGFANVDDYWDRGSALDWLPRIALPTLIINAKNDPFMPLSDLPAPLIVSPSVTLELPEHGGHVGFLLGPLPGDPSWMPRRVLAFFSDCISRASSERDAAATASTPAIA